MERRCVITGLGAVTPLGSTVDTFWKGIREGVCGIDYIKKFDASRLKVKIAAEVKDFDPEQYMTKKDVKRNDLFAVYGLAAGIQAFEDSGLDMEQEDADRVGVFVGSGTGGLMTMEEQVRRMDAKGPARVSPFFITMTIGNMAAANIAIRIGATGPCHDIVTACSTGTDCIGMAFRNIKHGYLDVCVAGGTDPRKACRPFDKERDGFVMGDGAGILVLEELEHALARGAKIYGEIVGYGATGDAYHVTLPDPEGTGGAKAMKLAIEEAGIAPEQVDYINAHGTSTPANDVGETKVIKKALGEENAKKTPVSSTKSMTGHLLGAAGAVEAICSVKALEDGFLPPTINYHTPDEECDLDYIPNQGREAKDAVYALSNSLGFGGHNSVLCFKKWQNK